MSILDTIVNADAARVLPNINQTRTSESNTAIANFGRSLPFRGLLKDVRNLDNGDLLNIAGLGWKVHSMPVLVQGKTENREAKGYQALVRGDNDGLLSITSDSFKPHQNSDILQGMKDLADRGDAEILYAGAMDEGRKVAAIARMQGEFNLPDKRYSREWNGHLGHRTPQDGEDKTQLFIVISGGHDIGTPFKVRGMAFRKWCGNGAFFTVHADATFTLTHKHRLTTAELVRLERTYASIRSQFEVYGANAAKLQTIEMQKEQSRLYVAELLKPGITAELGQRLASTDNAWDKQRVWEEVGTTLRGRQALDAIIGENEKQAGFARSGKHLVDAIVNQEGSNGANLWSGYNGVTWYVDHVRGRSADTGLDAALFGEGARLKERALETALSFVN